MKKHIIRILIISLVVMFTLACSLPALFKSTSENEPPSTVTDAPPEIGATEDDSKAPDPTPTDTPEVPATETASVSEEATTPPNAGQIVYTFQEHLWRYLIDSGENNQVTTTDELGGTPYPLQRARFSPDGRYLAFNLHGQAVILDLSENTSIDISSQGYFFAWGDEADRFYAVQGDFECPPVEELEDQVLINFDILRLDLNDLDNPEILANISGGLSYPQAISSDGEWASVLHCGCYSECGTESLYNLPTLNPVAPPADLYPGNLAFSPDSTQFTVSQQQMFGYMQSPLYVANSDYTDMVEAFSMPDVAPVNAAWSPTGEWIAFTTIAFQADEFSETDRCVYLARPDGSETRRVQCDFADFLTWSPDGGQLLYSQSDGTQVFIYDLATSDTTGLPIQIDAYTTDSIDWGRLP